MRRFVVDSSMSLAWCYADEADEYAEAVLQALADSEAIAPPLWPYEVANGLWVGERLGRLTPADIQRALNDLADLPISVQTAHHERARREVLELARQQQLTVYDAAYLDLAMREGLPIATLDQQLRDAATRTGVPEFDPS